MVIDIVLDSDSGFLGRVVPRILKVMRCFIGRFPSDSLNESDANIRALHNALKPKYGDDDDWIENNELIQEQKKQDLESIPKKERSSLLCGRQIFSRFFYRNFLVH